MTMVEISPRPREIRAPKTDQNAPRASRVASAEVDKKWLRRLEAKRKEWK